jgi:hypothetical protein
LPGSAAFSFLDRLRNSFVIEPTQKMMGTHFTSSNLRHHRQNFHPPN